MGLFSYVKLELPCPYCDKVLKDFQSKYGVLTEENEPWTLRNFYTVCPECKNWVEYIRKGTELSPIDLIEEGKQAVKLLRELIKIEDTPVAYDETNYPAIIGFCETVENFLKNCHYPADGSGSSWLNYYELVK